MGQGLEISSAGLIYVYSDITSPADVTGDVISAALMALGAGDPVGSDWQPAGWKPGSTWTAGSNGLGTITARVLVGTGSAFSNQPGTYRLLWQIQDNPEVPVLDAGLIVLT